jgi:hypothetical protein
MFHPKVPINITLTSLVFALQLFPFLFLDTLNNNNNNNNNNIKISLGKYRKGHCQNKGNHSMAQRVWRQGYCKLPTSGTTRGRSNNSSSSK